MSTNNDQIMVPQIQGFIRTHDRERTVHINPTTKNEVESYEKVPRGLKQVCDKIWEDNEFLTKMLGLTVGSRVRHTSGGCYIRDLFFSKVAGGPKPGGGYYAWLKFGEIWSNSKQDAESGDYKENYWIKVGLVPWVPKSKPQTPLERSPADPEGDAEVKEAQAQVDGL